MHSDHKNKHKKREKHMIPEIIGDVIVDVIPEVIPDNLKTFDINLGIFREGGGQSPIPSMATCNKLNTGTFFVCTSLRLAGMTIIGVPAGEHFLTISAPGFTPFYGNIIVSDAGSSNPSTISMVAL